jgi:hypothetical protein
LHKQLLLILMPQQKFYAGSLYSCRLPYSRYQEQREVHSGFIVPDDLAIDVITGLMAAVPALEAKRIDDVIVGQRSSGSRAGFAVWAYHRCKRHWV